MVPLADAETILKTRRAEADEFYQAVQPAKASDDSSGEHPLGEFERAWIDKVTAFISRIYLVNRCPSYG